MKKMNSKNIIIIFVYIIYLLFQKYIIIPKYSNYFEMINMFFCVILSIICYFIYGYHRNRNNKYIIQIFLIATILFFTLYYSCSFIYGFRYNSNLLTLTNIIKNVFINTVLIISIEYIRECFIKKNINNTSLVLISIFFTIIEMFYLTNTHKITNSILLFDLLTIQILPILFKNILLTYSSSKYGMIPSIIYCLITELYVYVFPYYPNINIYVETIIKCVLPLALLFRIKDNNDRKLQKKNTLYSIIILICISFFVLILGVFKYQLMAVVSNSMIPTFSRGDAVIFKKLHPDDYENLKVGDIIIYRKDNIQIIHRIIKKDDDYHYIYTKGDNNKEPDNSPVSKNQLLGLYKMKIPFIGYPSVLIYEILGK